MIHLGPIARYTPRINPGIMAPGGMYFVDSNVLFQCWHIRRITREDWRICLTAFTEKMLGFLRKNLNPPLNIFFQFLATPLLAYTEEPQHPPNLNSNSYQKPQTTATKISLCFSLSWFIEYTYWTFNAHVPRLHRDFSH